MKKLANVPDKHIFFVRADDKDAISTAIVKITGVVPITIFRNETNIKVIFDSPEASQQVFNILNAELANIRQRKGLEQIVVMTPHQFHTSEFDNERAKKPTNVQQAELNKKPNLQDLDRQRIVKNEVTVQDTTCELPITLQPHALDLPFARLLIQTALGHDVMRGIESNSTNITVEIDQLVKLAVQCPQTVISLVSQLPNYFAEFSEQQTKVRFIDSTKMEIHFYSLTKEVISYVIQNPGQAHIALTIDITAPPAQFNPNFKQLEALDQYCFTVRNGRIINQLVVVSSISITGLQELKPKAPDTEKFYLAEVDEDYKLMKIQQNMPRGIRVQHRSHEIFVLEHGHMLSAQVNDVVQQHELVDTVEIVETLKNVPKVIMDENRKILQQLHDQYVSTQSNVERRRIADLQDSEKEKFRKIEEKYSEHKKFMVKMLKLSLYETYNLMLQKFVGNEVVQVPLISLKGIVVPGYKPQYKQNRSSFEQKKEALSKIFNFQEHDQCRIEVDNGLNICKIPARKNLRLDCTEMAEVARVFAGTAQIISYLVTFSIDAPQNEHFKDELNNLISKFGFFSRNKDVVELKKKDQTVFLVDIRGCEAAHAFKNALTKIYACDQTITIPSNVIKPSCAQMPETVNYINDIIQEVPDFKSLRFDGFKINGNMTLAQAFVKELSLMDLQLPVCEIPLGSKNNDLSLLLRNQFGDQIKILEKQQIIIVPIAIKQQIIEIITSMSGEQIENSITFMACDQCLTSKLAIPITNSNGITNFKQFCQGCISGFFNSQEDEFHLRISGSDTLCFGTSISAFIMSSDDLMDQSLSGLQKLYNTRLRYQAEFKFCPNCDQVGQKTNDQQFRYYCTQCKHYWCSNCGQWHQKDTKCAVISGAVRCPHCGVFVIKEVGCDHISCTCGGHFCYRCGKGFGTGTEVYQHMATCTMKK